MKPHSSNGPHVEPRLLQPLIQNCLGCHQRMTTAYINQRTLTTLRGTLPLRLRIFWCTNRECHLFHRRYRPELEGRFAVPHCQFGLVVILAVGEAARKSLLPKKSRVGISSISAVQATLAKHGIAISIRGIRNLRNRYEFLLRHSPTNDPNTLKAIQEARYSILDIFEVPAAGDWAPLWVIRDWCTGGLLAAINADRGSKQELFSMIARVRDQLEVPVLGLVSDGHPEIRSVLARRFRLAISQGNYRDRHLEVLPNDESQAAEGLHRLQQRIRDLHTKYAFEDLNSDSKVRFVTCSPVEGTGRLFHVTLYSTDVNLDPFDLCRPKVWRNNRKG
jgi:hypothetical protein